MSKHEHAFLLFREKKSDIEAWIAWTVLIYGSSRTIILVTIHYFGVLAFRRHSENLYSRFVAVSRATFCERRNARTKERYKRNFNVLPSRLA